MTKGQVFILLSAVVLLMIGFSIDYQVRDFFMNHSAYQRGQPQYQFWDRISKAGQGEWYLIPSFLLLTFFFLWRKLKKTDIYRRWENFFLLMSLALLSSGALVNVLKVIFGRARPRQIYRAGDEGFFWFRLNSAYHSFPSGHTIMAMTAAMIGAFVFPRLRLYFLFLASLIAISRIITYAHYSSDVIAGIIAAIIVVIFWQRQFQRWNLSLPVRESQHCPQSQRMVMS